MSSGNMQGGAIREIIQENIMFALSQKGKIISTIEAKRNRKYKGDTSQQEYQNKPIWHSRQDLIEFVATRLKLNSHAWGPNRDSSDFNNIVDQEISKIRSKGIIVDWNGTAHFGIFRPSNITEPLSVSVPDIDERILSTIIPQPTSTIDTSEENLKRVFLSILTQGHKDNTYKFALARSILEYCRDNPYEISQVHEIPYQYLAEKFLKLYWHQICKYKMRQDFKKTKKPKVVRTIEEIFSDNIPHHFDQINSMDKIKAEKRILQQVFGNAKSKTSLVVPRFQNIREGNSVVENKIFYDYSDVKKTIYLNHDAYEFFRKNNGILLLTVLAEWAKFLEKANRSLPYLVAKIEKDDVERSVLEPFRVEYLKHTDHCFYCLNKLESGYIDVDHFIPWSYIFDDSAWNLVLSCQKCNRKKSNSLPQDEFLSSLINRNEKYYHKIPMLKDSLLQLNIENCWKPEIQGHYDTCKKYGFGQINLP